MKYRAVWIVALKELRETLRDQRTLIPMILLPIVLYPALILLVSQVATVQIAKLAAEEGVVQFNQAEVPESLLRAIQGTERIRIDGLGETHDKESVSARTTDVLIEIKDDFSTHLDEMKTGSLVLHYDEASERSRFVLERVNHSLKRLERELLSARLAEMTVTEESIKPLSFISNNVAPPSRMGGYLLGQILPIFLIMAVVLGAFYPAVDLTAGEKERGTLQTLMTAPVEASHIVAGKFLAVATITLLAGTLNLGSIALFFGQSALLGQLPAGIHLDLGQETLFLLFVAVVVMALFFSAVLMAVAVLARSFKEAQTYLTPVYLACLLPAMLAQLPGMSLSPGTALVPGMNLSLVIRSLLMGSFRAVDVLMALGVTLGYTCMALVLAGYLFKREAILLGDVSGIEAMVGNIGPVRRETAPGVGEAFALFAVIFILVFYGGTALQSYSLGVGLLITPFVLIFGTTTLWAKVRGWELASVFSTVEPRFLSWVGGGLLGLGAWAIALPLVLWLQESVLPMPEEMLEKAKELLGSDQTLLQMIIMDFSITFGAGICEEWLFRGPILSSLRKSFPTWIALVICALLFAALHLSLHRFLGTFLLGLVAGWIVIKTGSIFPAMLFHATNNAVVLTLARITESTGQENPTDLPIPWLMAGGLLALSGVFVLLKMDKKEGSPEIREAAG